MSGRATSRFLRARNIEVRELVADLATFEDDFPADPECPWCGAPADDTCTCSLTGPNRAPLIPANVSASGCWPKKGTRNPPRKTILIGRTQRRWWRW